MGAWCCHTPLVRQVAVSDEYIALTTRTEKTVRGIVNNTNAEMLLQVDLDGVQAGLEQQSMVAAYGATGVQETSLGYAALEPELQQAFIASADIALAEIAVAEGFVFNPAAKAITKAFADTIGKQIVEITEGTRQAVKDIINQAIVTGRHPLDAAKEIRQIVGLTSRQSKAVQKFRAALEADGVAGDKLDKRVARYAKKQRALRAENIARTETSTALNQGRLGTWQQLQESGVLPADQKHVWRTGQDERVCDICGPLDNQVVAIGQFFSIGIEQATTGATVTWQSIMPPMHPSCRCATTLQE